MFESVSESPSATTRLPGRQDIHPADEVPIVGYPADRPHRRRRKIPGGRNVVRLTRVTTGNAEIGRHVVGQIDANRQVRRRWEVERDRVADEQRAGRDGGRLGAFKGELPIRARDNAGAGVAQPDMCRADRELAVAVSVRQPYPQGIATDAGARVHPQGLIAEGGALGRLGGRGPGTDPMHIFWHVAMSLRRRDGWADVEGGQLCHDASESQPKAQPESPPPANRGNLSGA